GSLLTTINMKAVIILMAVFTPMVHAFALRMCNTGSECNADECCVSNNPPRGRRFLDTHSHLGHCVPMGTDGSSCLVKYSHLTTRPEDVVYACPCSNGLHCHGDGVNEVPLGERGHCAS
uniref:Prokineticin domain-containing protein n=2 Tax=Magallana gigas TaxID=29159 RepID=A0A8W8KCH1_MAGGI